MVPSRMMHFSRIGRWTALWLGVVAFAPMARGAEASTNHAPVVYNEQLEAHWIGKGARFWYRLDAPGGRHSHLIADPAGGSNGPAFDAARLAQALAKETGKPADPERLDLHRLTFENDQSAITFEWDGIGWRCSLPGYALNRDKPAEPSTPAHHEPPSEAGPVKSPDGRWEALAHGDNLALKDLKTGALRVLTYDGNPADSYHLDVERDRAMGMNYKTPTPPADAPDVVWSPDSKHLAAFRTRAGAERRVHYVESSPRDQLQPKLHSYPYLKPGDEIPVRRPHLFDAETGREIPVPTDLAPTPWEIDGLRWEADGSRFTCLYNERGHQVLRLLAVEASTGATRALVEERSATFIHYSGGFYCELLDASGEILWMSERDGWRHLWLFDGRAGGLKNQVTKGDWIVRQVEHVDAEKRQVWFWAGGAIPGHDPYFLQLARANFDGTGFALLTSSNGTHKAQFSPDRQFFIDTWSRIDQPPIHELRRTVDGALVQKLGEADISELTATGWRPPEAFVAKGRDGITDIYGIIQTPKEAADGKKHPVIEIVYAGPHDSYVPKEFRARPWGRELVDRGFYVVQVDGMGTANRSKRFHDYCYRNLADAGFADRILWIKAAAARHPEMDLSRVGIVGTSAGGQNALTGLLLHGDFYKAAVADCGCHDNRMDKIWWNEQWLGWPVGPQYAASSNVELAANLTGRLLLMVGEADENVDPASTMQVVDALVRANKDFELLVMPGAGHGVARTDYGRRKMYHFFTRVFLDPNAPF
jgi:dipeptidyl-peptidase 4